MFNMPIYNIWITAVIFVGIGLISLILWLIFRKRYVASMEYDRENNKSVTLQVPDKEDKTHENDADSQHSQEKTASYVDVYQIQNAFPFPLIIIHNTEDTLSCPGYPRITQGILSYQQCRASNNSSL